MFSIDDSNLGFPLESSSLLNLYVIPSLSFPSRKSTFSPPYMALNLIRLLHKQAHESRPPKKKRDLDRDFRFQKWINSVCYGSFFFACLDMKA